MTKIILIEDDNLLGESSQNKLNVFGYETKWVDSIENAEKLAKNFTADLLLIDHGLGVGKNGVEGVSDLKNKFPQAACIILSNYPKDTIEKQAVSKGYEKNLKLIDAFWNKLDVINTLTENVAAFLKNR